MAAVLAERRETPLNVKAPILEEEKDCDKIAIITNQKQERHEKPQIIFKCTLDEYKYKRFCTIPLLQQL